MKRILIALALLLPFSAMAQDRYDVPQTGTKVGLTRTGINSNFTFLFLAGTNAFRTAVEKGSNVNFVAKSPTNATQLDYCFTNGSGSAGSPQSPLTNDLDAAGNSIENLDAPEITNTTIFIRLWGTNVLSLQGTTNIALNGMSLKDGGADGNTPQGPWTNVVSMNAFAATGGDYVQVTNQIAFRVGTNLLAVQGWPDATNIAWNGAALINPSGGSGGGGAYAFQGTNNIAPTNANGNTIGAAAIHSFIQGSSNTLGTVVNSAILSGRNNVISNQGNLAYGNAVIAGGSENVIGGSPSEPGWWGFIGGGKGNIMHSDRGAIVGGEINVIADQVFYGFIGCGYACTIAAPAHYSVVAGGSGNDMMTGGSYGFIGGGDNNNINATLGVLGGGFQNYLYAGSTHSVIGGGQQNYSIGSTHSTVSGGRENTIASGAHYATIPGGYLCAVDAGATYGFAAGRRAKSTNSGAFVWADSTDADFVSTAANTFNVRASGGVYLKSGSMSVGVRQPLYLGAYTNVNPTTIIPTMQMDWYYDAGSNYILRTTDGTTNGWAHLQ